MATPTLEEKCTQLQLMSAPAFLAAWAERHPADRATVRHVLEELVDRELTRRSEQKVAACIKAARFVQLQTVETFHFDYSPATRKLRSRYLNLLATDLVAEGIGALFVGGSGLGPDVGPPESVIRLIWEKPEVEIAAITWATMAYWARPSART